MRCCIAIFACLGLVACQTTTQMKAQAGQGSEEDSSELTSTYDGASDSIDSLPDCTPELAGSLFWVRSDKAGYDCSVAGDWVLRPNARQPETEN